MNVKNGYQRFLVGHTDKVTCLTMNHQSTLLASGQTGPTMRDLTGAPCYSHYFKGKTMEALNTLWEAILEGEEMQYGMSAGTSGRDDGKIEDNGIVRGHSYTLYSAREIIDKYGEEERLV